MRDMPIFTTEYGVASLVLKEVPYRQEAYIKVQDVQSGELTALIDECAGFCRAVGAEGVYATGHPELEQYPLHTAVLEMKGVVPVDPGKVRSLFPVTERTAEHWRQLLNERMKAVDNAGTLEKRDEKRILESGGAYFVHSGGELLGVGWLEGDTLLTVASTKPGAGEQVMHTLLSLREDATIRLEVASTNHRAIRLYERLGFVTTGEISRWYRVR